MKEVPFDIKLFRPTFICPLKLEELLGIRERAFYVWVNARNGKSRVWRKSMIDFLRFLNKWVDKKRRQRNRFRS